MRWPRAQEFAATLLRTIVHGRVLGTSGSAQEAEPIAVDSDGKIIQSTQSMDFTDSGPHLLTTGAAYVFTPWININSAMGLGWYIWNTGGANSVTNVAYQWASGPNGSIPVRDGAGNPPTAAVAIAPSQIRYTSDPLQSGLYDRQTEWKPLYARSVRMGVLAGGLVTTVQITLIMANW